MGVLACDVFAIEEVSAGPLRRCLSALVAWIVAIITFGGTTTPIIQKKIVIREVKTGHALRELDDFVVDISTKLKYDLETLEVDAFIEEWLPELRA